MSEPKCPGCGAAVREDYPNYRRFECMTLEFDAFGPIQYELRESADCLRRQLAQRDERNAALEARIKELEADLAATAPVVRAAIAAHDVAEQCREINPSNYDHEDVCDVNNTLIEVTLLLRAVSALPADLLERMGVPDA